MSVDGMGKVLLVAVLLSQLSACDISDSQVADSQNRKENIDGEYQIVNSVSSVHRDGVVDWKRTILLNSETGETWVLTRDKDSKTFARWEPIKKPLRGEE